MDFDPDRFEYEFRRVLPGGEKETFRLSGFVNVLVFMEKTKAMGCNEWGVRSLA